MSKQPLTNVTPAIVIIAPNMQAVEDELEHYNFSQDETDSVPPVITTSVYTTRLGFVMAPPPEATPCIILAGADQNLVADVRRWCTNIVTTSKALQMLNNEYAIRRDQIINGLVHQT